jgi:hypothetical protein
MVQFSAAEVILLPADSKAAPSTVPYQRIARATYVHGRDPKWDPGLSAPAEKIGMSGLLARPRHWLVLQGVDSYVVLRLDGDDWSDLMKALEERARIVIDRASTVKKPD